MLKSFWNTSWVGKPFCTPIFIYSFVIVIVDVVDEDDDDDSSSSSFPPPPPPAPILLACFSVGNFDHDQHMAEVLDSSLFANARARISFSMQSAKSLWMSLEDCTVSCICWVFRGSIGTASGYE